MRQVAAWIKQANNKILLPDMVSIDLTNICNQDCYYCNTAEFRKQFPVQKNSHEYLDLLDRLYHWQWDDNCIGHINSVLYAGSGEPTLLKGYEQVVVRGLELGFKTSMYTNGTYLDKLIDNIDPVRLRQIEFIGVDIDAGTQDLYEKIRRSIPKTNLFDRTVNNIKQLTKLGVTVDLKILLGEYNSDASSIKDIFELAKHCQIKLIIFRPVAMHNEIFAMESIGALLDELAGKYQIECRYNITKTLPRNYSRCHQMFWSCIFGADGHMYSCCENKGNSKFSIGQWDSGHNFKAWWAKKQHWDVYNSVNTHLCPPCSPNSQNIEIQNHLDIIT